MTIQYAIYAAPKTVQDAQSDGSLLGAADRTRNARSPWIRL